MYSVQKFGEPVTLKFPSVDSTLDRMSAKGTFTLLRKYAALGTTVGYCRTLWNNLFSLKIDRHGEYFEVET